MPVGATIGAATIGAGASIYAGSKAAKAQKEASQDAAAAQNAGLAEAARINADVAAKNNAFAEHMYNRNEAWLSPTIMGGYAAGDQIMALLLGTGSNAGKEGYAPNGWYPSTPPKPVSTTPGAPGGPAAPTPQQSLDAWYTGAVNAMLPNITQPDNIARINAAATPEAKFQAAMAISPPTSDQYALYQAYVAQNPKPTLPAPTPAPATPAPATPSTPSTPPATNAVVAQQPAPNNAVAAVAPTVPAGGAPLARAYAEPSPGNAVAAVAPAPAASTSSYPRLADFRTAEGFDTQAFMDAREAHMASTGFNPAGSNGYPGQGAGTATPPAATPGTATPPAATPPGSTPPASTPPATAPNNAISAWDTWKNSTHYKDRLNAGLDAVATKYAAAGAFESGAEKKAIAEHAEVFASNELAAYMDQLYRQQALGAQSASSLAGVGTNLVTQVSNNNSDAANAAAAAAAGGGAATGNAILAGGQSSAGMWNNVGNAVGTAAGAIGRAVQPNNVVAQASPIWAPPPGYGGIYDDIYATY